MAKIFLDFLFQENLIDQKQYNSILKKAEKEKRDPEKILLSSEIISEKDFAQAKGKFLAIPFISLLGKIVSPEVLELISKETAFNYKLVPFEKEGSKLKVALLDPANFQALEALEFISKKYNLELENYITTNGSLNFVFKQYEDIEKEVEEVLRFAKKEREESVEKKELEETVEAAPISRMVASILRYAIEEKASDIHIEPEFNFSRVRYRIDGILYETLKFPKKVHPSVVSRIKILSNLKIDETRLPQDGRFRYQSLGRETDLRVSTFPTVNGEKVVMRILDRSTGIASLEKLGFRDRDLSLFLKNTKKNHGMFLVTGPTGSGKSTTLYSLLNILNSVKVNIITLEDPVEFYIEGINQGQIKPEIGLTFAAGLRSILRQDPNIIMVGEIRDEETAEMAIHAALTGHIVLSTLHTNDACGAVPRLIDMGVKPFLITACLNIIAAQRLVRRICQNCKEEVVVSPDLEKEIKETLSLEKNIKAFRAKGCPQCDGRGYKGRVAITEVLEMTPELQEVIVTKPDIEAIKKEARRQKMVFMKEDGFRKAIEGITSLEEVVRATRE